MKQDNMYREAWSWIFTVLTAQSTGSKVIAEKYQEMQNKDQCKICLEVPHIFESMLKNATMHN